MTDTARREYAIRVENLGWAAIRWAAIRYVSRTTRLGQAATKWGKI